MRLEFTVRIGAAAGVMALAVARGGGPRSDTTVSSPSQPLSLPGAVLSAEELSSWQADVDGFVEGFNAASLDAEAAYAAFTDDAAVVDPTNGDYRIAPKSRVVDAWSGFVSAYPEYSADTTDQYLGLATGVYLTEIGGVPPEIAAMLEGGVLHELRVFRFAEDQVTTATTLELWYRLEDAEGGFPSGCLGPGGCGPEVRDFVDRYLAAWSSRDETQIAALYRDDATFADSLLGVEASGAAQIGTLSDQRFGGGSTPACSPTEVYVQTNGDQPSSDNTGPDAGKVIGIALVYRCGLGPSDGAGDIRSASLLLFGTRPAKDVPVELDPDGLIVSEEVLHDPDSLTAIGIVQ